MNRIALLLALIAVAPLWAEPPAKLPTKFDAAAVDAYVAEKARTGGFVGLSIAIVRDGKIELAKAYGKTGLDGGPANVDTAFAIGSVTKQFTCACIFMLADEGKLRIEDTVSNYYPDLTRAKEITLYDLMCHVSGYPDYYPLDFLDRRMKKPIALDDLLKEYAGGKLDFDPRSRYSYSNTGYILLGRVVEKVSGEPFAAFLQKRILDPLGMKHSFFDPTPGTKGIARGATMVLLAPMEGVPPESPGWVHAAGGLYCSASDLAKWDIALMDGKLLKPASHRKMRQPRTLSNGKLQDYGCGLGISRQSGETIYGHGGAVSGFLAQNSMIPRTHSAVVLLSNAEQVDAAGLHRELLNLVASEASKAETAVPVIKGPSARDAAKAFFKRLQDNDVDRSELGEEFSLYLTPERMNEAAPRLKAYGEPTSVELQSAGERGGMEAARVRLVFKEGSIKVNMFRSVDGKIQQFLITK